MTQERFIDFLGDPDGLSSIPYEELKTLALAYPYAHNLRYLLTLKSQQDHHPEAARNLAIAAAHSLDRTRLFALIAPPQLTPQRLKEGVLELKPIETIQRELDALSPVWKEEAPDKQSLASKLAPPVQTTEAATPPLEQTLLATTPLSAPPDSVPASQPFLAWLGTFQPPTLLQPDTAHRIATSTHLAAPDFAQKKTTSAPTTSTTSTVATQLLNNEDATALASGSDIRSIAQTLAERSVAENKDVISETLARLLAKQGYRDKAIAMYERLGLAFPEKSGFFAAEIDKLKK